MSDTRTTAIADVYAGDTAAARREAPGAVFSYDIRADVEPDVLARVAGVCNLANVSPLRVSYARTPGEVHMTIELDGISAATADSIRRKLLQLTCVNAVVLANSAG